MIYSDVRTSILWIQPFQIILLWRHQAWWRQQIGLLLPEILKDSFFDILKKL